MRVLVTGASGYVGGAIAQAALGRGHDVVGLVHGDQQVSLVASGVQPVVGDLADAVRLGRAAGGVDGVIHAASSNDERAGELDRIAVTALLDELAGSDRPFVYTSGLWLHGNTGEVGADEDSPLDPPLVVSWRPAIERLVADAADRGVRSVRIRPAFVYGDGGGYIPMLLSPREGVVRPIEGGRNRWAVVHRADLADLYVLALEKAPAGSVYLGSPGLSVRVTDVARAVAEASGARLEDWPRHEAEQVWSIMVEAFLLDQAASGERAKRELGWSPQRPSLLEDIDHTVRR